MWTEDVENHSIAIPRSNCFEDDLPSACYHQAVVGPNLSKRSFRDSFLADRLGQQKRNTSPRFLSQRYCIVSSARSVNLTVL